MNIKCNIITLLRYFFILDNSEMCTVFIPVDGGGRGKRFPLPPLEMTPPAIVIYNLHKRWVSFSTGSRIVVNRIIMSCRRRYALFVPLYKIIFDLMRIDRGIIRIRAVPMVRHSRKVHVTLNINKRQVPNGRVLD